MAGICKWMTFNWGEMQAVSSWRADERAAVSLTLQLPLCVATRSAIQTQPSLALQLEASLTNSLPNRWE